MIRKSVRYGLICLTMVASLGEVALSAEEKIYRIQYTTTDGKSYVMESKTPIEIEYYTPEGKKMVYRSGMGAVEAGRPQAAPSQQAPAAAAPARRPAPAPQRTTFEAVQPKPCYNCTPNPLQDLRQALDIRVYQNGYTKYRVIPGYDRNGYKAKQINDRCESIMKQNGQYGPVGVKLHNLMVSKQYAGAFLKKGSLTAFCPRFDSLTPEAKMKAWTWFWMVLANEERDCAAHLSHPMHDPRTGRMINPRPAFGMWAIETYPQKWRGPMCTNGAVRDVQTQVNCAVHTMADIHIRKRGQTAYDPLSYWGPVRRYQKQILPNMRLHKPCYQ